MKWKAIRSVLDRTPIEAGSNDDLTTELEFTETLSRLSTGYSLLVLNQFKYSAIKHLLEDKTELFTLYEESPTAGKVSKDWSHGYLC